MARFRFKKIEAVEDILEAIGRPDIPSTEVTIRCPAVDEATGEVIADLEIDFGPHSLSPVDEEKLLRLLEGKGLKLTAKV